MADQEGIVWKRYPGLAMADGSNGAGSAVDPSRPDYARLGDRLQRDYSARGAGTATLVYEMPDGLLRAPTPLELQLYEPPLYLPEAPTTPLRQIPRSGRLHARIYYAIGNSGLLRIDCDWIGSVPLVAHKSLSVHVVTDDFFAGEDPAYFEADYEFSDSTATAPAATVLRFDAALPAAGAPLTTMPTAAYVSRSSVGTSADAADFTGTHDAMTLLVSWGSSQLRWRITSVTEHDTWLEIALGDLVAPPATMPEDLLDEAAVTLRFEDATTTERVDVSVGLLLGSRAPLEPPTYTHATTPIEAGDTASFVAPAFARRLRCAVKYGYEEGSEADAPLGQWFVAFINRNFGALSWIDAASAREGLFGPGIFVPPGTHSIVFDNRSADPIYVTPSFVLGL